MAGRGRRRRDSSKWRVRVWRAVDRGLTNKAVLSPVSGFGVRKSDVKCPLEPGLSNVKCPLNSSNLLTKLAGAAPCNPATVSQIRYIHTPSGYKLAIFERDFIRYAPTALYHRNTRAPPGRGRMCWPPLCKTRGHATTRRACRHPPPAPRRAAASSGTLRLGHLGEV